MTRPAAVHEPSRSLVPEAAWRVAAASCAGGCIAIAAAQASAADTEAPYLTKG